MSGPRGPAPTPTKTLEVRGSRRAESRTNEANFETGDVTCPGALGREGKAEWRRQVKQLQRAGLLQVTDRALLVCWCEAWQEFIEGVKTVAVEGWTIVSDRGVRVNPALRIKQDAADRLLRLAQQFGFSPSARTRIKAVDVPKQDDPFEELLNRASGSEN